MSRLPRASGREVVRALERGGFVVSHTRGSHVYLRKPGAAGLVTVPVHAGHDLPPARCAPSCAKLV
ncbi:MAG TPA: type II toxin-antitoxin system HicA family toxin [Thermomicrobiaceae bacterium]|nr:type II toxin-antitoxin system HicA family toxin [Thermomicrobiaceae bacterium]